MHRRTKLLTLASAVALGALGSVAFLSSRESALPRASNAHGASELGPDETARHRVVRQHEAASEKVQAAVVSARDEMLVMRSLRALLFENPAHVLELARAGHEKFPTSERSAERTWYEARALVELGRLTEAREVARSMMEQYPDAPWTADARRHLLHHPLGFPPRARQALTRSDLSPNEGSSTMKQW